MQVTSSKNCYCHTCMRSFHYLGITRHRSMHRDKKENCTITYTDGKTYEHKYNIKTRVVTIACDSPDYVTPPER